MWGLHVGTIVVAIAHDMVRAQLSNGVATREDEAYLAKVLGVDSAGCAGARIAKAYNGGYDMYRLRPYNFCD
jgi:hypothetical protein